MSSQKDSVPPIPRATGCTVRREDLRRKEALFPVTDFGVKPGGAAAANTQGIRAAMEAAARSGGGTVVFPAGEYKTYTIRLRSRVNLYLEKDAVVRAARTDIRDLARDDIDFHMNQKGEGGNYDEPEVNPYVGLQDHGHSYFANSLLYGADVHDVMIYGEGLLDGSDLIPETGVREYVLQGGDPQEPDRRDARGHRGQWFGNKCLALLRCRRVVLSGFGIRIGGHFAVIAEGVTDLLIEDMIVDTTRDALDIDCCQDVTVRRSTFNSLTDDGVVMKASYGAGTFMPTRNVCIEDCVVSGYDAGSVLAGLYTTDKLVADDRCGPTGRVKFGTESTCGYDLVTIRRVKFDRSRGFAMEAVDGSDLSNVVFSDCEMTHVSSSPIFIRIGDRARYPVTGNSADQAVEAGESNVRLDDRRWVLPCRPEYTAYPAARYAPAYRRDKKVTVDGKSFFPVVDPQDPVRLNPANFACRDGRYYALAYHADTRTYEPDFTRPVEPGDRARFGNAIGAPYIAGCYNIEISNLKVTDADPRYPILLAGLVDSRIRRVVLRNISVEYRGGLKMEHAVEQRQLDTDWQYTQYQTAPARQSLPWLVNSFFCKEEGLLPRVSWDAQAGTWRDDPYNVPEQVCSYPEPSIFGILPAYGLYARHVEDLTVKNLRLTFRTEDGRPAVVLDDVADAAFAGFSADVAPHVPAFVTVTNTRKRHTNFEYYPDEPYLTTRVTHLRLPEGWAAQPVQVDAPVPGTPCDRLYAHPTLPIPENGYRYPVPTEAYPLPRTVFRPYFRPVGEQTVMAGQPLVFTVCMRDPAGEARASSGGALRCRAEGMPSGASFDPVSGVFRWVPQPAQAGVHTVRFVADDGVLPQALSVRVSVR